MTGESLLLTPGREADLHDVMTVMNSSFDPGFGEAWTFSNAPACCRCRGSG